MILNNLYIARYDVLTGRITPKRKYPWLSILMTDYDRFVLPIKPYLCTGRFSGLRVLGNGVLGLQYNIPMVASRQSATCEEPSSEVVISVSGIEGADAL